MPIIFAAREAFFTIPKPHIAKKASLKKEAAALKHRQNAVSMLESVISGKLKEIKRLSESLSREPDIHNKNKLIRIKLLTGYCKRIGMLMLSDKHQGYVMTKTLRQFLSAASADVSSADITCNIYYADKGRLPRKKRRCSLHLVCWAPQRDLSIAFAAVPNETFEEIQELFSLIGVSVTLSGKMPDNSALKSTLLQIIREASTNAVRHGNAKNIKADIAINAGTLCMTISNDGTAPSESIREGSGIKGMREQLSKIHGSLSYDNTPEFCLRITLTAETRRSAE